MKTVLFLAAFLCASGPCLKQASTDVTAAANVLGVSGPIVDDVCTAIEGAAGATACAAAGTDLATVSNVAKLVGGVIASLPPAPAGMRAETAPATPTATAFSVGGVHVHLGALAARTAEVKAAVLARAGR
jgi:hypothetical protein